jgi:RNA polymerase sigma-70 factor (ECF subfamily)
MASYEQTVDAEFLTRLRQYVRRRVATDHDADDLVQETLVKLLDRGAAVAPESARAWLFTVARHAISDGWRRKRPRAHAGEEVPAPDPEEGNEAVAYLARCMEPMLAALPPKDRELLLAVDVRETSQAEIARRMSLSPSVVKSRVQRARKRLRGLLEGCCSVERDGRGTPVAYRVRPEGGCPCALPAESGRSRGACRD